MRVALLTVGAAPDGPCSLISRKECGTWITNREWVRGRPATNLIDTVAREGGRSAGSESPQMPGEVEATLEDQMLPQEVGVLEPIIWTS